MYGIFTPKSKLKIKNMTPKNEKNNKQSQIGPFGQVVEQLKNANNILVTVSKNPSLDQLAACIGLTIALNKYDKHATAVFSGKVPSAIDFLKPDETLERNTDSLRDFIIALDKSKADKLRYKVEDDVVKIFITPYKTSITEEDLRFSQGDFNVDTVVVIGIQNKADLDTAVTAHGRILHDATLLSIGVKEKSDFTMINWNEPRASSLSEMITDVLLDIKRDVFDSQIATSLLTGIVVETDRFRNEKVSPHTMSVAGVLMSAGASTQLVATKLEESKQKELQESSKKVSNSSGDTESSQDGTLQIEHSEDVVEGGKKHNGHAEDVHDDDNIKITDEGKFLAIDKRYGDPENDEQATEPDSDADKKGTNSGKNAQSTSIILEPPSFGGRLTANSVPEDAHLGGSVDPLSQEVDQHQPLLGQKRTNIAPNTDSAEQNEEQPELNKLKSIIDDKDKTLADIERSVDSPHLDESRVREDVEMIAEAGVGPVVTPKQSSGAQILGDELHKEEMKSHTNNQVPSPPPPVPPPMMPPTTPK